jgi:hypothetical protein
VKEGYRHDTTNFLQLFVFNNVKVAGVVGSIVLYRDTIQSLRHDVGAIA